MGGNGKVNYYTDIMQTSLFLDVYILCMYIYVNLTYIFVTGSIKT